MSLKTLTKILLISLTFQQSLKDPYKAKITKMVALSIKIGDKYLEKPIILGLFGDETPKTVENFYQMCTKPNLETNGLKLSYLYSTFHRIVPYFMIQGGDITRGNGEGGWSIYGSEFKDENFNVAHDVGTLSMANSGKDSNNSQFFISTEKVDKLNGRYVVFGIVVENMDVVYLVEGEGNEDGSVKQEVMIYDCYDPTLVPEKNEDGKEEDDEEQEGQGDVIVNEEIKEDDEM